MADEESQASIFSAASDAEAGNAAGGAAGDDGAAAESAYQTSKRASANVGELLAQGRGVSKMTHS